MSHRPFLVVVLVGLSLDGNVAAQAQEEPVLAHLARVQVMLDTSITNRAPELADRWHTGRVAGGMSGCIFVAPDSISPLIFRPDLPPDTPAPMLAVPLRNVLRLRVSTKYDGRFVAGGPNRVYERGANLYGEEWREVAMDSVMLDDVECER